LQRLPSPQLVPSTTGVFTHPTAETQLSCVHGLLSPQFRWSLVQRPATHRSFTVQTSLSTQSPFATQHPSTAVWVHPLLESQASTVHGLPSSHVRPAPSWSPRELSFCHGSGSLSLDTGGPVV